MIAAVPGEDLHHAANRVRSLQRVHTAVHRVYVIEHPLRELRCTTSAKSMRPNAPNGGRGPSKAAIRAGDTSARLPARGRAVANRVLPDAISSGEMGRTMRTRTDLQLAL